MRLQLQITASMHSATVAEDEEPMVPKRAWLR